MTPARRYQRALRTIRRRRPSATYRDAQAVYRLLRAETLTPLSARQLAGVREGTIDRLLRRARALGSRTTPTTPAKRKTIERQAGKFNPGTKEKPDVPTAEKQTVYTLAQWERAWQQSTPAEREPIEIETSPDYARGRAPAPSRRARRLENAARKRSKVSATTAAMESELAALAPEDRAAIDAAVDELRALRGERPKRRRRRRRPATK